MSARLPENPDSMSEEYGYGAQNSILNEYTRSSEPSSSQNSTEPITDEDRLNHAAATAAAGDTSVNSSNNGKAVAFGADEKGDEDTLQVTKRRRFGTIRRKRQYSGGSSRKASVKLREFSQHVPGLSSVVAPPEHEEAASIPRTLYINQPLPEHEIDPETHLPKAEYARNKLRTTKYTPLTFIPLDLYYQFHNIANIYFLFIVILSAFPIFGVVSPGLAAVPIIVIVIITAFKDAIEDYRRMALDSEVNNSVTRVLINYPNNNVVADQVSRWRRFKKWNTRFWGKIVRSVFRFFLRLFKQPVKPERDAGLDLAPMSTRGTESVYQQSEFASSVYAENANNLQLTQTMTGASSRRAPASVVGQEKKQGLEEDWYRDGSVLDTARHAAGEAVFKRCYWKNVECGSIVKVKNNEEFPADLVVLSTSDPDGACYIETRNLDGETNLKVRQCLKATAHIKHGRDLERSVFRLESEGPNPGLYSYNGALKWEQRTEPNDPSSDYEERTESISINNMLLRGCTLRNTKWVIGVCVYTGADSKVILNAGETPAKRSRIMRELNKNVIYNFIFVILLAFVAGVVNGVYFHKEDSSAHFFEFGSIGGSAPVDGLVTFWAAVILLQNLIPISLYISIEIIKTLHAFFIWNDTFMYYEPVDYRCTPKSWSISDDLGQVEYIFSDKTGTLTQNVMEFRKATINGVSYGKAFTEAMIGMVKREGRDGERLAEEAARDIEQDRNAMVEKIMNIYDNPEMSPDVKFVSSAAVDDLTGASGEVQQKAVEHFWLALALCHSVLPERNHEDKLEFKAQSPDEEALVDTARDMGFTLLTRTRRGVEVDVLGNTREYEVLTTLEFNSSRKRMSVIIRDPDTGKLLLICKGADSVIYSRLSDGQDELKQTTADQLEEYANEGLRTLCLSEKEVSEDYYNDWAKRYDAASSALENREELMEECAHEMEQELTLIGGTAIEDRLQEGVPDSIALLGKAGIKIWVLTGDKIETAINIGYSCNLLSNDMELLVLQLKEGTKEEADGLLTKYLAEHFNMTGSDEELAEAKKDHSPSVSRFAVVVDGDALSIILDDELRQKFVLLCKQCKSVLCCRVSPSQKAAVVSLVKNTLDVMTLSIGDGANDVAMITEADVGCGIAGVEGRQAVMSSDYAFGQFRFLSRLLLVHGRWAYRRVAEMTANLFFKNVVFTLTLFWYDTNNSFDGSYLFDYTYITLFNLAFTSLPVIFMGFLDQDVSDKVSMVSPELYRRGILRKEWTQRKFWLYMLDGVYQSAVCYFFAYGLFAGGGFVTTTGQQNNYREAYGVFVATVAIAACNFYVMLNEYMWDWLFLLIVAISTLLVFFWTGIYTQFTASAGFYKAASQVYGSLSFWANCLLALVVCLLPRFVIKSIQKMYFPRDVDIIRERVSMHKYDYLNNLEPDQLNDKPVDLTTTESRHAVDRDVELNEEPSPYVGEEHGSEADDIVRQETHRSSTYTGRSSAEDSRYPHGHIKTSLEISDLTTAKGLMGKHPQLD